mmetsp:Transcript_5707/g.11776  ORF Transcript_5707/g.11776 Transcript_5707/m.11776 type:complete len:116 (-) Transcript_5707:392-739(-)
MNRQWQSRCTDQCLLPPASVKEALVLSKLVSLASDHGFQLAMTMVGQQATSNTTTISDGDHVRTLVMSVTATINEYIAIESILSLLLWHLLLYLQLQSNLRLFVSLHSPLSTSTT